MRRVGLVHVTMEVCGESGTSREADFLVDSGAIYSVLPHAVWKALGLRPKRSLRFTLADGSRVRRRVSECRFVYGTLDAVSPVILGERRDAALLGVVTLESLGLVLNPFDRSLRPMRMLLASMSVRPTRSRAAHVPFDSTSFSRSPAYFPHGVVG